ncbi:hypothetical protein [Altericista sp. CCNU0014]|uniref:hypothetical protein n=1 Tax=Altericista sp. CCNU0014 TaxID=3082949 RepID=UPI00384CB2A6
MASTDSGWQGLFFHDTRTEWRSQAFTQSPDGQRGEDLGAIAEGRNTRCVLFSLSWVNGAITMYRESADFAIGFWTCNPKVP